MTRPTSLHAYLAYRDAPAALEWLQRVFGFAVAVQWPDERGGIQHAELRLGDAVVVVFSEDGAGYDRPALRGATTGRGIYLSPPDDAEVDAVHARAVAAGATVVWEPHATEWGGYRCRVLDPEGHEWSVNTYRPGEPAGGWS